MPVYPATGVVRLDGKPFGPCVVHLVPVDKFDGAVVRSVMGTADAEGKITFGTYGIDDGAAAGDYKVVIRSSLSAPPPSPIPAKYGSDQTTPLTASILDSGPNEVAVDMQAGGSQGAAGENPFNEAFQSDAFSAGASTTTAPQE